MPRYYIRKIRTLDIPQAFVVNKVSIEGLPHVRQKLHPMYMEIHVCVVPTVQVPLSIWAPYRPRTTGWQQSIPTAETAEAKN